MLKSVLTGWSKMSPLTALGFVLSGFALWGNVAGRENSYWRRASRILAATVAVMGTVKLAAYFSGSGLAFDLLAFHESVPPGGSPARMALATAFTFVLVGSSLLLSSQTRLLKACHILALFAGLNGCLGLSRYIFGGETLLPFQFMAVHTSAGFILLSAGIFCLRPFGGLVELLLVDRLGVAIPRPLAFGLVVIFTAVTLLVRLTIGSGLEGPTMIVFTIPVIMSAYFGGLGPGLLATVFSALGAAYFILPPLYSFHVDSTTQRWQVAVLFLTGGLIAFICSLLQRSRERAQRMIVELREKEGELYAALKDAGDLRTALDEHAIVAITNHQGIITAVNDKFCAISGYSREELLRQDHRIINSGHHSKEFIRELWTTIANGKVWQGEIKNRAKDGSFYWVATTIVPFLGSDGKPRQYVAIRADITERKRAETAVQESEERFRTMANSISQLAWIARADGFIFWYNQRWYEYTGTKPEQMEGWGWQSVHDPRVLPTVMEKWTGAIAAGQPFEMEFPLRGADGKFRNFLTRGQPLKDAAGGVVQWFGTNTDVEVMKRMEESLRATQIRLNSTLAAGSIGTWTWDIVKDRLIADEFTARVFGIETSAAAEGLPAAAYLKAVMEEDQPAVSEALARAIETCGHYDIEYRIRQEDGTIMWLLARGRVQADSSGEAVYFHGAIMDITESKTADETLSLLSSAVEQSKESVTITDAELDLPGPRILFVNPAFTEMTGYASDEVIGKTPRIFQGPRTDRTVLDRLRQNLERGEGFSGEAINYRKDGSEFHLEWQVAPIRNASGKITHFVALQRDISERKATAGRILGINAELEQRVRERTMQLEIANKELEAFSYSVSHDLRAPLRAVDGFSQAVIEDYGPHLPEGCQSQLLTIRRGAQKMGVLIDDLLAFSRLSRAPLNKQEVDTGRLVGGVLEDLSVERKGREIELRVGDLPACSGDPALLKQVWINLISNAFKYTTKSKSAMVEIGCEMKPEGKIFFVRDNGTGFDMRYADKLFGVFQRLHRAEDYEGTGVGLAIVQRIIHRHGGRIWADAALERGATFSFTLDEEHKL